MIHWIGQCQSRSAEYTESEALSKWVHSCCLVEPSALSSASVPPSAGCQDGYDCRRQCLSVVYTVLTHCQKGSSPTFPHFSSLSPSTDAPSLTTKPILASTTHPPIAAASPHRLYLPPSLLPLLTFVASPDLRCTPPPSLPPHIADASPRRRCLPPPSPPRHTISTAATGPLQHTPPDTEGPLSGSPHTRRGRCHRPPAGTAVSGGDGGSGWGGAIRGGGGQRRGRRQRRGVRPWAGGADRGGGGVRRGVAASGRGGGRR